MKLTVVKLRRLIGTLVLLLFACTLPLTGCTSAVTPRTQTPVANSGPMTHSRAARECWMRTEKANAHENLDKRAELVNKCIDEKLKAAGVSSPRT
mgnify:CR=1 FL=1